MDNSALRKELEAIKQDLLTITDMQLKLKNRADEWEAKIEEAEGRKEKDWPQEDDWYYYLTEDGEVESAMFGESWGDDNKKEIGNCYRTKEEAEFELERLKVITQMKKLSVKYSYDRPNYAIFYRADNGALQVSDTYYHLATDIYFETREQAEEVIKQIGKDKLKKYYFGVVE